MTDWAAAVTAALQGRVETRLHRVRSPVDPVDATGVQIAGRRLVNFSTNDYLGLAHHPRVRSAFSTAAAVRVGSGASALVTGYATEHKSAEEKISAWKKTESAVLVPTGFAANQIAVQTIAVAAGNRPVRFFVDKLSHASLIDAVRSVESSTVSFRVFPHNHVDKLRRLLGGFDGLRVVVTESVFSMDGDFADLPALVRLRRDASFLLLLDEAHASGVYGPDGSGYAAGLGLSDQVDLTVVTFSKAVGCVGGAVCGSSVWSDAIVNFARPYIYSTSLPAAVAVAISTAIDVIRDEPDRRARLLDNAGYLRRRLNMPGNSPIVPVISGNEETTLAAAQHLRSAGYLVGAIRPPTVPRGQSRLRVTLSAEHTHAEMDGLLEALPR